MLEPSGEKAANISLVTLSFYFLLQHSFNSINYCLALVLEVFSVSHAKS